MKKLETELFLREGLKAIGSYSPAFEPLIENTAQMSNIRDLAFEGLEKDGIVLDEFSREGDSRKRPHPAWPIFLESSKEIRANLDALQMTVKTAKFTSGDNVDKINYILQQVYDQTTKPKRSEGPKRGRGKSSSRGKDPV